MKKIQSLLLFSFLIFTGASLYAANSTTQNINGEQVSYQIDGVDFTGYIAYDTTKAGKRPGVIIVHEWWGHNDYVRQRADQLAAMGYTAFALDMYGKGTTASHPDDAMKFMMDSFNNMDRSQKRFIAAKTLLENHPSTFSNQTAAIGYCFGGGVVLQMARNGLDLKAVASFHGNLATHPSAAKPGQVKAKLLVMHGADDPLTPTEQVQAFKQEMNAAKVDYDFIAYPNAVHAFTNKAATKLGEQFGLPLAYNAQADQQSWARLDKFLADVFSK